MTITFGDTHIDTLIKLKELAVKHGMLIRFGTESSFKIDEDVTLLDEVLNFKEYELDYLDDNSFEIIKGDVQHKFNKVWFELCEPRPKEKHPKYHTMSYTEEEVFCLLEDGWKEHIERDIDILKLEENEEGAKIVEGVLEKFEDNAEEDYLAASTSPTIIFGFGKEEKREDYRVYRSGMALHYFMELVCDYLGEPHILNTY